MSTVTRYWNSPKTAGESEFKLNSVAISLRGTCHKVNEDHICSNDRSGIYLLADGMGGHDGGAIASEFVCRTAYGELAERKRPAVPTADFAKRAIRNAVAVSMHGMRHLSVQCPPLVKMGTTLVVGWIVDRNLYFANVGNSRLYRFCGRRLERLTTDHSLVEELYQCGIITDRQRKTHPWRHRITRYVGPSSKDSRIDFGEVKLRVGDQLLFVTDGISNVLSDRSMGRAARSAKSAEELGRWLVAAAKAADSHDDLSCIVVDCNR